MPPRPPATGRPRRPSKSAMCWCCTPTAGTGRSAAATVRHLLELAPQFTGERTVRDCLPVVLREFGDTPREEEACVLVARVTS
ncbi:hypothetical protein ACR6C2_43575 [Streptomyces sp. INA 01156]